jgi:hypothetical protein
MLSYEETLIRRRLVLVSETGESIDLGAYKSIGGQIIIHEIGSGGSIGLEHSATNKSEAFTTLGNTVTLTTIANDVQNHTNFLRFVRYVTDGSVAGNPIVSLHIVAKEY